MGFKYPKFQQDYENKAKAVRKNKLRVLWGVIFMCLLILACSIMAINYMKSQQKTFTLTIKQAPIVKQEKQPASTLTSVTSTQAQPAPVLQGEVTMGKIVKCTKDGKIEYRDYPCK